MNLREGDNFSPTSESLDRRNLDAFCIGYVGSGFPLLYENIHGAADGIYKRMWSDTLRKHEYEFHKRSVYGNYDVEPNGFYGGVLGEVQNGTVDATVDDYGLYKPRMDAMYYTLPISDARENFYEATQSRLSSSIIIVPFRADFTSILVTLVILMKITDEIVRCMLKKLNRKTGISQTTLAALRSISLRFAVIQILVIYNAAFVGLNVKPAVESQRDLSEIIPLLKEGKGKLVVNYEGNASENLKWRTNKMCCVMRRTLFSSVKFTHNDPDKNYKQQCSFKAVKWSKVRSHSNKSELVKARVGQLRYATIYMSRKTVPRKIRERFHQVQLRIYQHDQVDEFWWRRYTVWPRYQSEAKKKQTFSSIGISAIETILIVFGAFIVLSGIVFIYEIVHFKFVGPVLNQNRVKRAIDEKIERIVREISRISNPRLFNSHDREHS